MPRGFSRCRRCVAPGSSKGSAFGSQASSSQASSSSRRSRKIGSVLSPRTRRAGRVTRLASSCVNAHCCTAGNSWPKNVSALATAWSNAQRGASLHTHRGNECHVAPRQYQAGSHLIPSGRRRCVQHGGCALSARFGLTVSARQPERAEMPKNDARCV